MSGTRVQEIAGVPLEMSVCLDASTGLKPYAHFRSARTSEQQVCSV